MSRYIAPVTQYLTLDSPPLPLAGGKLTFYVTGTSTLAATYSNAALSTPNTNPVILDADGYPLTDIFLSPLVTYRVRLTTSANVEIWDHDPVTGFVSQDDFNTLETTLTDQIDTLTAQVSEIVTNIHRIGDSIITLNEASPADQFGGVWVLTAEGQMIVGFKSGDPDFGTVDDTGGSKTHTNTTGEMVPHKHRVQASTGAAPSEINAVSNTGFAGFQGGALGFTNGGGSVLMEETGSATPYSILNPFRVFYIWVRTA